MLLDALENFKKEHACNLSPSDGWQLKRTICQQLMLLACFMGCLEPSNKKLLGPTAAHKYSSRKNRHLFAPDNIAQNLSIAIYLTTLNLQEPLKGFADVMCALKSMLSEFF